MNISWFGLSSFKITAKDVTIITDPFGSASGLSPVRGAADIVISSNPASPLTNNFSSIQGNPFVVTGSGEYEIKGVFIAGAPADEKNSSFVYSLEVEDVRIAFIGQVKQGNLTEAQKEVLEGADVVLVPVGNNEVLDSEEAAKLATQLEPFYIVPHSYAIPGLKGNFDKVEKFIKEMGGETLKDDKLQLKKKELVGESTKLVVLEPQR